MTKGSSIYDVRTEVDELRWTHVDGGQGHADVHTENL